MAIICCLCGKKQSSFIQDFPLIEKSTQFRICSNCQDRKQRLLAAAETRDYEQTKQEFLSVYQEGISPEVKSLAESFLESCDHIYDQWYSVNRESIEQAQKANQEEEKRASAIENLKVTTGFDFQGYAIPKYIDVVSGESVLGTGFISEFSANVADLLGTESQALSKKFQKAKSYAMYRAKQEAYELGANAIIGVSFSYPLIYANIVAVVVNGTAVVIEPEIEKNDE